LFPQPIIQILDLYGNPLKGRQVIAISWPLSNIVGIGNYDLDVSKYAILQNQISEKSNEFGVA